ncbi:hydrogenase maturation protease [Candidatus Bipolaricaulota bacterium]|nr:hydrogenase maturation protease [Candidatus Bipolaricaulota bacterium]
MELVIGIGNELRGDDGIGPHVVDALPDRPDLETMTVHQLVPELADRIRTARRVLFVDASLDGDDVCLRQIEPSMHRGVGHSCSPAALLGWTKFAYAEEPEAWLLSIPSSSFEFGNTLSERTESMIPEAIQRIEAWLNRNTEPALVMSEEEA